MLPLERSYRCPYRPRIPPGTAQIGHPDQIIAGSTTRNVFDVLIRETVRVATGSRLSANGRRDLERPTSDYIWAERVKCIWANGVMMQGYPCSGLGSRDGFRKLALFVKS